MSDLSRYKTISHHAFVRSLGGGLGFSLSDSCAETMSVADLQSLSKFALSDIDLNYSSLQGLPALREQIAKLYTGDGVEIEKENVAIFSGAQDALYAAFNSILNDGDEVILFTPCYPPLLETPRLAGASVVPIPLKYENRWQIDISQVIAAVTEKTKLILLNFPHNPTGAVLDQNVARDILTLAKVKGIHLLVDDVSLFSDFNGIGIQHRLLSYDRTIVVGVMSKSFGLAGVRIGWSITSDLQQLERMMTVKSYTSICPSVFDEYLALAALENCQLILDRNNGIIKSNVELFEMFLKRMSKAFEWVTPRAGILGMLKNKLPVSSHAIAQGLAEKEGVLILPGDLFSIEGEFFRIGLGRENFPQVLSLFERYIQNECSDLL
ncbi:MAG: pyridoxal phosphate-dependent aminotransferase [Pseudomonadales bacterium]|nr:pyridoxal phosphate-dependent aminotransferase [Pseudomonadales bacterium]